MGERWRKPVTVLDIVEDENTGVRYTADRDWYRGVNWTVDAEGFARMKAGYVCVQCLEPQETPFPDQCSLCGFEIARLQRQALENEFQGEKKLGPSTTLSDELERMDFENERARWERDGVSGLLVPRSLDS